MCATLFLLSPQRGRLQRLTPCLLRLQRTHLSQLTLVLLRTFLLHTLYRLRLQALTVRLCLRLRGVYELLELILLSLLLHAHLLFLPAQQRLRRYGYQNI